MIQRYLLGGLAGLRIAAARPGAARTLREALGRVGTLSPIGNG